jgi:serine protease AprX
MSIAAGWRYRGVVAVIGLSAACFALAWQATAADVPPIRSRIGSAGTGFLSTALASKLDPRLLAQLQAHPGETVAAWVELADKGEQGPGDLAARLAAAEAALAPRARARRLRCGVHPLVDQRDLPLHGPYVEALKAAGLKPYGQSRWFNRVAVRADAEQLDRLAALPFVVRLGAVERMRRSFDPSRLGSAIRAAPTRLRATAVDHGRMEPVLAQIRVPTLHDSGYVGTGVLVCVLDEGFNFFDQHEALRDQPIPLERQRDFVRGVQSVQDTTNPGSYNHGTWVLGCLAGNKPGRYVGAAYGAEFALARTEVHSSETPQEMVNWGMGAEWADSLGADIISSSLGYFTFDDPYPDYAYPDLDGHTTVVSRAAEIAAGKGILVVNAVGNEGNGAWHYLIAPSDVDGDSLIAVGAVDAAGAPAGFSSYGPSADGRIKPDVAARGVSVPVPSAGGDDTLYIPLSGTSFATPQVAGVAACLMQARPAWSARDVARALRATASRASNPDDRVGYGIVDACAALHWAPSTSLPLPPEALHVLRLLGPNPMRSDGPAVRVSFGVAAGARGMATMRVFDAHGREVRRLWSGMLPCTFPAVVSWDGRDEDGRSTNSGLYFITLVTGGRRSSVRVVSLR